MLEALDRVLYAQGVASARLQLGDEQFEKVREEGRAMNTETAIENALQHPGRGVLAYEMPGTEVKEVQADRKRQVDELHISVNQAKKARQVEAITGTEYFIELQGRARSLLLARQERGVGNDRVSDT